MNCTYQMYGTYLRLSSESSSTCILGSLVRGEGLGCIFSVILVIFDHHCAFAIWAAVPWVLSELGATRAHQIPTHHALAWVRNLCKACATSIFRCFVCSKRLG